MLGVPDLDRRNVTTAEAVISVRGLRKRYGDVEAVAGIDLQVSRGEIFAFLGPNGAGKTTTVEILEGFRERSGGEVSVLGVDPAVANRRRRNPSDAREARAHDLHDPFHAPARDHHTGSATRAGAPGG